MDWLLEHWDSILTAIAGVVTVASVVVKLTPTPKDNEVLAKVRKILEKLALTPKK